MNCNNILCKKFMIKYRLPIKITNNRPFGYIINYKQMLYLYEYVTSVEIYSCPSSVDFYSMVTNT